MRHENTGDFVACKSVTFVNCVCAAEERKKEGGEKCN